LNPWEWLANLPEFDNIVPSRIVLITYLCVAVMLGLIVEHTYRSVRQRQGRLLGVNLGDRGSSRLPRWSGAAAGVIVAAIALVPPALYLAQNIPISTEPLVVPTWFRTVAPHLRGDQVVLSFPTVGPALMWQAVDHMHFSIPEGPGPGASFSQEPEEVQGVGVIGNASLSYGIADPITPSGILAVRRDLDDWKVTTVVIPDEPGLPVYDQIPSVTVAAALVTAATGKLPVQQSDAWVWTGVNHSGSPVPISTEGFSRCTFGQATHGYSAVESASDCVRTATH
jgi:hypothetical protein